MGTAASLVVAPGGPRPGYGPSKAPAQEEAVPVIRPFETRGVRRPLP
jgi:hypothetical protein